MNQAELVRDLQRIMGRERVLSRDTDLLAYSYDASFVAQLKPYPPDVVVRPTRTEEVRAVIDFANRHRVPVVPRGAGSNMCGSALPVRGGIVMDLSGMNRILELDLANLQVVVEPGVVHADLKDRLAEVGFFFPPDPGSSRMCTLGGMVANNSSGMRSVKYGTTRNYVLGLEVVLPTGEVVITGGEKFEGPQERFRLRPHPAPGRLRGYPGGDHPYPPESAAPPRGQGGGDGRLRYPGQGG